MLNEDIKCVDEFIKFGSLSGIEGEEEAWSRIKKLLQGSEKTPTNKERSAIGHCLECVGSGVVHSLGKSERCHRCGGWGELASISENTITEKSITVQDISKKKLEAFCKGLEMENIDTLMTGTIEDFYNVGKLMSKRIKDKCCNSQKIIRNK